MNSHIPDNRTQFQQFFDYNRDQHNIIIHNPLDHNYKQLAVCKNVDLSRYFKQESTLKIGRGTDQDIPIPNRFVSGSHIQISRLRSGKIWIKIDAGIKNATYKLLWGILPIPVKGKELPLTHGDTFVIGNPLKIFSLWRWSVGKSVKLTYHNPIPLPFSLARKTKTIGIRSVKTGLALLAIVCLWMAINWQQIPGTELPDFDGAPVVIYANDQKTSLKPLPAKRPDFIQDLSNFGEYLPNAVIASEDRRFKYHIGIDPVGITRAIFSVFLLKSSQGGSTLHQQVARTLYPEWVGREWEYQVANTWLAKPATVWRKLREIPVALKLNFTHSKQEILLAYLNTAPLGHEKYGFVEAAQYYFKKPVKQLNLAEASTLVAMLPEPNNFINLGVCSNTGEKYLNYLSDRRRRVIEWMEKSKYLKDKGIARQARLMALSNLFSTQVCSPTENNPIIPRIYDSLIYKELYNIMQREYWQGNLVVETTIDPRKQIEAHKQLTQFVNTTGKKGGVTQGALVSIDPKTGGIVAIAESVEPQQEKYQYILKNTKEKNPKPIQTDELKECEANDKCIRLLYNFASQEELFPGSTFKVFAYAAALEKGISANKIYDCKAIQFEGERFSAKQWKDSYCGSEQGSLDMLTAIGTSDNLTALKVAKDAGLEEIINLARRFGITSELNPSPRLILGESDVKLLEITSAYGVFANRGYRKSPHIINRIIDLSNSNCTYENYRNNSACVVLYSYDGDLAAGLKPDANGNAQVIDPAIADKMTILMKGTVADGINGRPRGTASNVNIKNAAGKTGTQVKRSDLWFIGYVPNESVTGVWLGNPPYERDATNITSRQAAQIWQNYMENIGYSN